MSLIACRLVILASLVATACSALQTELPSPVVISPAGDALRLVLIGDSGTFDASDTAPCDPATKANKIPVRCRELLLESIRRDAPDAVIDLGDLVYESGPLCVGEHLNQRTQALLDTLIGELQTATGSPLVLVLGNHDVHHSKHGRAAAERCYRSYARQRPQVHLPERNFILQAGPVDLVILDTNRKLDDTLAHAIRSELEASERPWTIFAGHHVWRTYFDKEGQDEGPRFAEAIGVRPQLWLNGHVHMQQFGIYDGVAAVTSGAAGKLRERESCLGPSCPQQGLHFALSRYGYALLTVYEREACVEFKDVQGQPLFAWRRTLDQPEGEFGATCGSEAAESR